MGSALLAEAYISPEDYLAAESVSEEKHEYLAGVIYAMAGLTLQHDRIAGNIFAELRSRLRGGPCEVFSPDVKVRIRREAATIFYYPDVTVDCTRPSGNRAFVEHPSVLFEVISPATERIDRGEKRLNYQALASLDTYVVVEQSQIAVTVYRRTANGWMIELLTDPIAFLDLFTLECTLPLTAIYERTGLLDD